jgi:hypothetical protein
LTETLPECEWIKGSGAEAQENKTLKMKIKLFQNVKKSLTATVVVTRNSTSC